jgi:hypothetical protein
MAEGLLFPVFQPILDFRVRAILGYESLIRGPENSPLHWPADLFATAARHGLTQDLEHACREASLRAFAAQRLPGRLFLNVTPGCLLDDRLMNGHTRSLLGELAIAPNRLVLELTENQQITDMPGIQEALLHYRGAASRSPSTILARGSPTCACGPSCGRSSSRSTSISSTVLPMTASSSILLVRCRIWPRSAMRRWSPKG